MSFFELKYHETPPEEFRNAVIAIGNFDGVHRGHVAMLGQARQLADRLKTKMIPVTFDPHPLKLLDPNRYQSPLTTIRERTRLLRDCGVDHVVALKTTPELLALSAEYFFETIINFAMKAKGIVEGFNFQFGHNREGSNVTLQQLCSEQKIEFQEVSAYTWKNVVVSSSLVRNGINSGDFDRVTELLNRPYRIEGIVTIGAQRGRIIGYPTANLSRVETLLPPDGVYAVRSHLGEKTFAGAANIGPNPTFGELAKKVEIHLLDFAQDIYNQELSVEFISRLRSTMKFGSVNELTLQMQKDISAARQIVTS